jgi:hypothetical protein
LSPLTLLAWLAALKPARVATVATALAVALFLANGYAVDRIVAEAAKAAGHPGEAGDFGVMLPFPGFYLCRADTIAKRFGALLLPMAWVAAFGAAVVVRRWSADEAKEGSRIGRDAQSSAP